MARPKTGRPTKKQISLTVSEQARKELEFISQERKQSISALLEEWAHKESKKIAKELDKDVPNINQMEIQDFE